jgi:hypothetical protein
MAYYLFEHPKTKERIEIKQSMEEIHEFQEDGVKWNRIFTVANASVDTKIDPFSSSQFVDRTREKRGTVGNLMDYSKECSERRQEAIGSDPVKTKNWEEYSKLRCGKKHPEQRTQEILAKIKKNKRIEVE